MAQVRMNDVRNASKDISASLEEHQRQKNSPDLTLPTMSLPVARHDSQIAFGGSEERRLEHWTHWTVATPISQLTHFPISGRS